MSRIAFFGTPELAAVQLRALLDTKHDVVLVVAQPDRPKGRGQKLEPPPTKQVALERKIVVAQPETLKKDTASGEAFFAQLEEALYGWVDEVESNTIEVHVYNLRKKLGSGFIRTVRHQGYGLAPA